MRSVNCVILTAILFGASGFFWCNQIVSAAPRNNVTYAVRGSRNVKVRVVKRSDCYDVTVSMLAVTVFDAATNRSLSLLKSKQCAFAVLGKHLSPGNLKNGLRFTVQGLASRNTSLTGSAFSTTYRIPFTGVKWVKVVAGKAGNAGTPIEAIAFTGVPEGNLLTRPADLKNTFQLVYDLHTSNGVLSNSKVFELKLDEFLELQDAETAKFLAMLEQLKAIVRTDNLLLDSERPGLQDQLEDFKDSFGVFIETNLQEYTESSLK